LRLVRNEEVSPDMVLEQAVAWGYERVSMVSNPGEVARRGDILDIMPPGYDKPLRLDFFGDLIEEIRVFDPATQRSKADLPEALVLPVHPVRQDSASRNKMTARWKRLLQKGLLTENEHFGLVRLLEQGDFRLLPGCCYDASTVLEEWLPKDSIWLLPGRCDAEEALTSAERHWANALEEQDKADRPQPLRLGIRQAAHAADIWNRTPVVHAEPLRLGIETHDLNLVELQEHSLTSFSDLFPLAEQQDRPWQTLVQALKGWQTTKRQVILCFASERSRGKFLKLAEQDGLFPALRHAPDDHGLFALVAPFRAGADMLWDEVMVLGEDILQPHVEKSRRVPSSAFRGLDKHDELTPGDLLVHRDYGIARFNGLLRMDLGGTANDFLLLNYAGDDRLYLPVDRLSLIQRFKGSGDVEPALDRLGGGAWQAGKEKALKAIEKIAEDLVEMYAWRKVAKGFRYPPTGELYREFEA
ncbi:MAG: CarD family transcriptional regulator, partial [Bilophila sp.]